MTESDELEDRENRSGAETEDRAQSGSCSFGVGDRAENPFGQNNSGDGSGKLISEDRFEEEPLDDDPRVVIGLNRFIDALIQASDRD
ncbi:MAG: hypothetical protein VB674_00235 [Vicinamibacterales bacterium]